MNDYFIKSQNKTENPVSRWFFCFYDIVSQQPAIRVFLKIGIALRVSPDLTGYYLYKDMSREASERRKAGVLSAV